LGPDTSAGAQQNDHGRFRPPIGRLNLPGSRRKPAVFKARTKNPSGRGSLDDDRKVTIKRPFSTVGPLMRQSPRGHARSALPCPPDPTDIPHRALVPCAKRITSPLSTENPLRCKKAKQKALILREVEVSEPNSCARGLKSEVLRRKKFNRKNTVFNFFSCSRYRPCCQEQFFQKRRPAA